MEPACDIRSDLIETLIEFLDEGTEFFHSMHLLPAEKQLEGEQRRRVYDDKFAALVGAGQRDGRYRIDIPRAVLVANFFSDLHFLPRWYSASRARRICQYRYCQHLDERVIKA